MRGVIYGSDIIDNSERKLGSNTVYYPAEFISGDGESRPLLFTSREIDRAMERAAKNPEDIERSRSITDSSITSAVRAALVVIAALAGLLIIAALAGCGKRDVIVKTPEPPLVTCGSVCRVSCAVTVPLWSPPDANSPEAFDFIRPQVVEPLAAAGKRCDERRQACWSCIESIERAGVIRLPGNDGG